MKKWDWKHDLELFEESVNETIELYKSGMIFKLMVLAVWFSFKLVKEFILYFFGRPNKLKILLFTKYEIK